MIKGIPWAGKGFITKLEISIDGGITWLNAMLESAKNAGYGWQSWSYEWTVLDKGEYKIMTKATDSYDRTQPTLPFWLSDRVAALVRRIFSIKSKLLQ
ncbi:hypothetical protein A3781_20485 [Bacillus badius]|nr:hypothetical protein A3781_20485 [Bacillus badius]